MFHYGYEFARNSKQQLEYEWSLGVPVAWNFTNMSKPTKIFSCAVYKYLFLHVKYEMEQTTADEASLL